MPVAYQHNRPALGIAANWNALLDQAHGRYCLLMHHDEFPLGDRFVTDLIQELREDPAADVLLLDCVLVDPRNGQCRRHLPTWLRAFVVRRFPQYLFRRNVIGPTASLVVRRTMYPRFDEQLQWLIDVDAYVRLLQKAKRLRLSPHVQIGSILGRTDSLTASLGAAVSHIAREERAYLAGIHHAANLWLGPIHNEPIWHSLLRACEAAAWRLMRGLTRMTAMFGADPAPRSMVRRALS